MEVKHVLHHKEIDDFRIKYDVCLLQNEELGINEQSDILMSQNAYDEFQKKINDFLVEYAITQEEIERLTCQADGLDYALSATSGLIAGMIDIIFIGEWNFKEAKAISNEKVNNKIMEFAKKHPDYLKFCNNSLEGKGGQRIKPLDPERLETAIMFLEWKYQLPGDNTWNIVNQKVLSNCGNDIAPKMSLKSCKKISPKASHHIESKVSAKSHHLDDFSHHPTLMGLICCIISQFTRTATYYDREGTKIQIPIEIDENGMLEGKTPSAKIASGFINWIINVIRNWKGHLYSDMGGTKSTAGGGAGIPGSFMSFLKELSALPIFEESDFSEKLYRAFTQGIGTGDKQVNLGAFNSLFQGADSKFDLRTEEAIKYELKRQAIPVVINEVLVRSIYFIRHLQSELKEKQTIESIEWKKVIPLGNRTIVRMLTVSTGVMELVDMIDAAIRSGLGVSKFVLRINFVGIGRFAIACSTDLVMGAKRNMLEYAIASADVAITATEEVKMINNIQTMQEKTNAHLKQVSAQVDAVYNMIN